MFAKRVTVEVHDLPLGEDEQGKYLVQGENDVLWTDSLEDVLAFIQRELEGESD